MNNIKFKILKRPSMTLLIAVLLVVVKSFSQDTIYVKSKKPIVIAKILEVNITNLKYKKYSYLEGPTYTIDKGEVEKVVFQNGDVEEYSTESFGGSTELQVSTELMSGSRVFLTYSITKDEGNVSGVDARRMLRSYVEGKTTCVVVNSFDEADFVIDLRVIKKAMGDRSAKIIITHRLTNQEVFESKWVRGTSTAFSGYSSTRAAIGKLVKSYLLKTYPEIGV